MEIALLALALLLMASVMLYQPPPEQYVYGKLRIAARNIYADVYIRDHDQDCDCTSPLWHGGTVTVKADLSQVQVGDIAYLTSLDGDKMVVECVGIRPGWGWLARADGDVVVINDGWVYRFTRL